MKQTEIKHFVNEEKINDKILICRFTKYMRKTVKSTAVKICWFQCVLSVEWLTCAER